MLAKTNRSTPRRRFRSLYPLVVVVVVVVVDKARITLPCAADAHADCTHCRHRRPAMDLDPHNRGRAVHGPDGDVSPSRVIAPASPPVAQCGADKCAVRVFFSQKFFKR